jgi:uncharacterized protein YcbX
MPITVSALNVYPVKGLKGIALDQARCTDRGLEHDRRWMVVDAAGAMLTQREHPKMATVWTEVDGDTLSLAAPDLGSVEIPIAEVGGDVVRVEVWGTPCDAVANAPQADAFLSEHLGFACRLVHMHEASRRFSNKRYAGEGKRVSFADGYAYLLISEASLADLNAKLLAKDHPALPMNRFRPNLVVTGSEPFAEDRWKQISIGGAVLRAAKPCGRCQVTTTDQATGEVRGPEPLATLSSYRESAEFGVMFGMNLVTVRTGTIRIGDALALS